jgi:uncharacterized membrane protein YfcA
MIIAICMTAVLLFVVMDLATRRARGEDVQTADWVARLIAGSLVGFAVGVLGMLIS